MILSSIITTKLSLFRRESQKTLAYGLLLGLLLGLLSACSTAKPLPQDTFELTAAPNLPLQQVAAEPSAPEGVVRYCWEEPMVAPEKNGPGINPEGTWYSPSYIAVREVRSGKWRPCR